MLRNRIISIIFIIASTIFVSYYVGKFAYVIFYASLIIPLISIVYTFIVYIRFKLNQNIDKRVVLKGELTPYEFVLSNEGFISYVNIKVNFFDDKSYIEDNGETLEYSLLPNEREVLKSNLCCKYRGEYEVGVKSVAITDYFSLFTITYPILTKLNLTVFPRVVELEHIGFEEAQQDNKNSSYTLLSDEQILDTEVRKYEKGDHKKLIHWKLSAKKNELLTRKYYSIPKTQILIMIDFSKLEEDDMCRIITEDKIVEIMLAISKYYCVTKTPITVNYEQDGFQIQNLKDEADFKEFYQKICYIHFDGKTDINEIFLSNISLKDNYTQMIIVSHKLTEEMYFSIAQAELRGINVVFIYVNDLESDLVKHTKETGALVYHIHSEDNISKVF